MSSYKMFKLGDLVRVNIAKAGEPESIVEAHVAMGSNAGFRGLVYWVHGPDGLRHGEFSGSDMEFIRRDYPQQGWACGDRQHGIDAKTRRAVVVPVQSNGYTPPVDSDGYQCGVCYLVGRQCQSCARQEAEAENARRDTGERV